MVSQGRRDFQGLPSADSGAKIANSLAQKEDDSQSHTFEASNKDEPSQNIQTNNEAQSASDERSENISQLPCTEKTSDQTNTNNGSADVSSGHLRNSSGKARDLNSENQMLLSGVQTIPEQLPLILTEGDAEEHESLTIIAGNEQLQGVSTQAVLGNNNNPGASGMMVFSSAAIAPSGQIIPIGGTNLLVLHSLDGQGQVYQQGTVFVQAGQTQAGQTQAGQTLSGQKEATQQSSEEKDGSKEYKCPEPGCSKVAPTSCKLKLHMLSHTGERPHKCPLPGCDWAFTTAYKLKRHMRGHTGEKPFICEINNCGKTFTTTYNLKTHQKAHVREQTNVCLFPDCGLSFTTLHRLRVHEKKHVVSHEVHTCNIDGCGKQFKSLGYFNTHVKTHTGERPHACTYEGCDKRFTKASKLKLHVRTHTGERPFVCNEESCNWSFTSAYKLKRHMRKHSGERPFTCDYPGCGKSFTRASHMRTHQMSHTGEKPFICSYENCRKGFTAASTLTIHLRKHSGDRPFRCAVEGCDKAYTTAANLRLHQKRHEEKNSSPEETLDQEHSSDQPASIHYVDIGGVNSVVSTSRSPGPNPPYPVIHPFSGEDFASEDVASLTVVHYSTEETFPPETPVSDSSHGICFQFSSNDSYAGTSHGNVSFTAGTPLPSPGAHYVQASMDVEVPEDLGSSHGSRNTDQVNSEGFDMQEQSPSCEAYVVRERGHIVRERAADDEGYIVQEPNSDDEAYIVQDENAGGESYIVREGQIIRDRPASSEGYVVREQNSPDDGYIVGSENSPSQGFIEQSSQTQGYIPQAQNSERSKTSEDLTLPTMVVFISPDNESPGQTVVVTEDMDETNEQTDRHITLREPTSIGQSAPPSIIFQGKEVKHSDERTKLSHNSMKDSIDRSRNELPVSNLSLNLSLSDDIDKSPVSPFTTHVHDNPLDPESTINLQDLR